jgi:hypothetical protein
VPNIEKAVDNRLLGHRSAYAAAIPAKPAATARATPRAHPCGPAGLNVINAMAPARTATITAITPRAMESSRREAR